MRVKKKKKKTVSRFRTVFHISQNSARNSEKVNYSVLNGKTTLNQFPSLQSNSYALQASGIEYL